MTYSKLITLSFLLLTVIGCSSTAPQYGETIVTTPNKLELNGRRYAHAMVNDGEKTLRYWRRVGQ